MSKKITGALRKISNGQEGFAGLQRVIILLAFAIGVASLNYALFSSGLFEGASKESIVNTWGTSWNISLDLSGLNNAQAISPRTKQTRSFPTDASLIVNLDVPSQAANQAEVSVVTSPATQGKKGWN